MIKIIRFIYLCPRGNAATKPSSSQDPAKHAEDAMVLCQLMQSQSLPESSWVLLRTDANVCCTRGHRPALRGFDGEMSEGLVDSF